MVATKRGREYLTSAGDRKNILELIAEAMLVGCRSSRLYAAFDLEKRTIQRWGLVRKISAKVLYRCLLIKPVKRKRI